MSSKKYADALQALFKSYKATDNFQRITRLCRIASVQEGKVRFEFEVDKEMTNDFGTLHGGYTASLIDICRTTAFTKATLSVKDSGKVIATGLHTKALPRH